MRIWGAVLGLILLSVATLAAQFPDWVVTVKPVFKQVTRLEMLIEGAEQPGACSGPVINKDLGYVLTAAHCVEKPATKSISITINGRHAEIVRFNTILDLAILKTQLKSEQQITFAPETPEPGTPIAVVGYAFGYREPHPTFGFVSQNKNTSDLQGMRANADVIGGQSGGAVIDGQGRMVAVISLLTYWYSSGLIVGVPVEVAREFAEPFLPKVTK